MRETGGTCVRQYRWVRASMVFAAALPLRVWGTTYYVSPTGSDGNSGTDPSQPWRTVGKVDSTTFSPGSEILFQRGGVWGESLAPSCSGTAGAPISFSDYGSSSLANPVFTGADALDYSGATLVPGTTTAYSMPTNAAWVGAVLVNDSFLHEADLLKPLANPYQTVLLHTEHVVLRRGAAFCEHGERDVGFGWCVDGSGAGGCDQYNGAETISMFRI